MNNASSIFNPKYLLIILLLSTTYCAYYNTFFNAEENYRVGLEKKKNSPSDEKISKDITSNFEAAISKSWAVIEIYGDSNSWADDALLLIGKSHYHLQEYDKSQDVLEQFLQKYLRSPLKSDAELWLAQTFVAQGNTDDALARFSSLISNSGDDDILADAYLNIGEIYFESEDYQLAISNYQKCIEIGSTSVTAGNAQYKLADSYYNSDDFENAVINYEDVLQYDMPIIKQYDAVIQMSNSLLKLNRFDDAEEKLLNIMRDQRFKPHYSMIATKLANMIEFRGDTEFALDKYFEVIENYSKSEGSALASFYIAQIYEFEYGWLDSAKVKYEDVKKLYGKSESVKEANNRAKILTNYLSIRNKLSKDKDDIFRLEHGDSLLVDSLEVEQDSSFVEENEEDGENSESNVPDNLVRRFGRASQAEDGSDEDDDETKKPKKTAITRKPEEVEKSLLKNSFNIAEFFLLSYQHYDSAKIAYVNFVDNFTDSLLTPKAYYSLYYIYNDINHDSLSADSIKQIILSRYADTIYGKKLSGVETEEVVKVNVEIKNMFLRAESHVDREEYEEAILLYSQIAEKDSGSIWAQKSRYATAFVYENYLYDMDSAIESYAILAKEYPKTEQGKIASFKVAEPFVEVVKPDTTIADTLFTVPDTSKSNNDVQETVAPDTTLQEKNE